MACSGQQRGNKTAILLDFETSYAVDPSPFVAIQMPFLSESLSGSRAQNVSEVINGRRDPSRPFEGNKDVQGDITVPIDKRYFGYWLKAILGVPTTSGVGPYTHVFKINSDDCQPSMVIEKQMLDIPRYFKYTGVKIKTMSINFGGDGELTATFSMAGQNVSDSGTSIDASPTTHTYEQFRQFDGVLNEGGSASGDFISLSMTIDAGLDESVFTIGNEGTRGSLPDGKYSISGQANTVFDSMTLYNKAKNTTESSIAVVLTRGAHSLTIDMGEIEYALQDPKIANAQGVVANFDFMAFFDNDADNSAIVVTLVNDVASYA